LYRAGDTECAIPCARSWRVRTPAARRPRGGVIDYQTGLPAPPGALRLPPTVWRCPRSACRPRALPCRPLLLSSNSEVRGPRAALSVLPRSGSRARSIVRPSPCLVTPEADLDARRPVHPRRRGCPALPARCLSQCDASRRSRAACRTAARACSMRTSIAGAPPGAHACELDKTPADAAAGHCRLYVELIKPRPRENEDPHERARRIFGDPQLRVWDHVRRKPGSHLVGVDA